MDAAEVLEMMGRVCTGEDVGLPPWAMMTAADFIAEDHTGAAIAGMDDTTWRNVVDKAIEMTRAWVLRSED